MLVSPSRVICPSSRGRRSSVGLERGLLRCRVASSIDGLFRLSSVRSIDGGRGVRGAHRGPQVYQSS